MTLMQHENQSETLANPLDSVEELFEANEWSFEREGDEEITAVVPSGWCDYQLRFFWRQAEGVLQAVNMFDLKVPEAKRGPICETLALINERLWMGHFESWTDGDALLYRHATFLDELAQLSPNHAHALVQTAVGECDRFYPVFQFVLWAGKSPAEAVEAAMLDTVGNA
ncbi:MAG: YbjN domain-containing protein [Pseudomonadota bacterium]